VHSWNDVESGIASVSGDSVAIVLADGRAIALRIHQAALADRLRASLALQPFRPAILGTVIAGRPADRAGLKVMDTVLAINGEPIAQWYDLVTRVRASGGQPLTFQVARGEQRVEVTMLPEIESETIRKGVTEKVGKIGAGPFMQVTNRPYSIGAAFGAGARATLAASTQIIRTVQGLVSARISSREVGGPILIGQMAAQSARLGIDTFLSFMALVSVNLAVLNLLPIPVLDGGQFLFLMAEGVLRRPLSLRLRERLTMVGLFLIVCLMVLAFSNDIRRLLGV
jgi:regulator of sigma E protease